MEGRSPTIIAIELCFVNNINPTTIPTFVKNFTHYFQLLLIQNIRIKYPVRKTK